MSCHKKPYAIIINGQPCSGKTHLMNKLSSDFKMAYLSRDEIKEQLFDDLGVSDSEWSKKLGGASYSLFYKFLEKFLINGNSFILEGNFSHKQHFNKFKTLFDKYGFNSIEILLFADPNVLLERYKSRWNSGERHRGHADHERFLEFEIRFKEDGDCSLGINTQIIKIDTTEFSKIDYSELIKNIKNHIKK